MWVLIICDNNVCFCNKTISKRRCIQTNQNDIYTLLTIHSISTPNRHPPIFPHPSIKPFSFSFSRYFLKMAIFSGIVFIIFSALSVADGRIPGNYAGGSWQGAHATFYGGSDASGTMGMSHFCIIQHFLLFN